MHVHFAAGANDELAMVAGKILKNRGHPVQVLQDGSRMSPVAIALFSSEGRFPNRFLRVSAYNPEAQKLSVPNWVHDSPFLVALKPTSPWKKRYTDFDRALAQVAETYGKWHPSQSKDAPWNPVWHRGRPREFASWRTRTREVVPVVSGDEWMEPHLTPIFCPSAGRREVLVVSSCAVFNVQHTDVVETLSSGKTGVIVETLANFINGGKFSKVKFQLPGADTMDHAPLRSHLHPFMDESLEVAEGVLGKKLPSDVRLWGRRHKRSWVEIAQALKASQRSLEKQVLEPLQKRVSIPVCSVTWAEELGDYLPQAYALAKKHIELLRSMYNSWIITGPAASTLHRFNPTRGLERTVGNVTMYFAEALFLQDHRNHMVANCEQADVYWRALEPVIAEEVWGDYRPLIGMVDPRARQPWGY